MKRSYSLKRMDGQSVLITGGLGFIGSSIAHVSVGLGAKVTIYDALLPQYGGNLANVKEIRDKVTLVKGDIRDFDRLSKYVTDQDLIFNCAAQTGHIDSMRDPYLDIDINCRGMMNVLEATRRFNDNAKIVYTGTRSQIGKMRYSPMDEVHPEFPHDIHAANKSVAEKYHLIYHKAYGIPTTSIRFTNTYGPRAQTKSPTYGVLNYFIGLAVQDKTITVYEPGTQTRDCIYVDDVVDALILAAQSEATSGEVFFVASGKEVKFIDFVKILVKLAGSGRYELVPWPKERTSIEVGDISISFKKINERLGWHPKTNLETGLRKTIEFYKENIQDYL